MMQREVVLLPAPLWADVPPRRTEADPETGEQISAWLDAIISRMRRFWGGQVEVSPASPIADAEACVEQLVAILFHRTFNHQARGRGAPLRPHMRRAVRDRVTNGRPVTLFFLYNGGYRASPIPGTHGLIFWPDQTELMLLFQVTLLQEMVTAVYAKGVDFVIVINNGVATWVNDIDAGATEAYAARLRQMIAAMGAQAHIRVLVQSELPGYNEEGPRAPVGPQPEIDVRDHRMVERFLGRPCSAEEARHRRALYDVAEAAWAEELRPIASQEGAILLRQVANASMASFRPFPGGAIRAQNGTLGVLVDDGRMIPKLVTTSTFEHVEVRQIPMVLPPVLCAQLARDVCGA